MKKSLAILAAVGVASAACAQSLDIEPVASQVQIGEAVTLKVFGDPGPADYAIAAVQFQVDASGGDWANNMHLIPASAAPPISQNPGTIVGSSVTGIVIGQLGTGFGPNPGRIALWQADFSSGVEGVFDISTTTARFDVFTEPGYPPPRRTLTPTEGSAQVTIVPAPAGLPLLGLGALAGLRRRRPAREMTR